MASARTNFRRGFTLIELLVVIAIIAIIAAILFPVFAKVREKARQTTVLANFEKIQRGLGEYQLDYHHYPPAIYGYAVAGAAMGARQTTNHNAPSGLFPQFISDVGVFQDPDNKDNDKTSAADTNTVSVKQLQSDGTVTTARQTFYKADAFDANPQMNADGRTLTATPVARYQTSWTDVSATGASADKNYARQLRSPNPPGDTFVTLTTYHVPNNAVLVLWQTGSAKTLDPSRLTPFEANGTFWNMTPGRG